MYTGSPSKRKNPVSELIGTAGDVAQLPLGVASEAVSDAFGLGSGVVKGVGDGVGGAVSGVGEAIEGVGGPVGKVVAIPVKVAGDVVSGVGKAAGGVVDGVGKVVGSIVKIPSKIIGGITGSGSTDSDISGLQSRLGVGEGQKTGGMGMVGIDENAKDGKYLNASNVPGWDKLSPDEQAAANKSVGERIHAKALNNAGIVAGIGDETIDPMSPGVPSPDVQALQDAREEIGNQEQRRWKQLMNQREEEDEYDFDPEKYNERRKKRFIGIGPAVRSFFEGPQS